MALTVVAAVRGAARMVKLFNPRNKSTKTSSFAL